MWSGRGARYVFLYLWSQWRIIASDTIYTMTLYMDQSGGSNRRGGEAESSLMFLACTNPYYLVAKQKQLSELPQHILPHTTCTHSSVLTGRRNGGHYPFLRSSGGQCRGNPRDGEKGRKADDGKGGKEELV